ncbi:hypothetical protein BDZ89DRAFT_947753 [Hymenopellis radicata]|nr:hypothetical protein BDZ89DRAFT_947753 [Hymenopellis radicata]
MPIYDSEGYIFAVLAGRPNDDGYVASADKAFNFMRAQADAEEWKAEDLDPHRRGGFIAINVGITAGKGQPGPTRLGNGTHALLTERLLGHSCIQQIATFGSSAFQRWSPNLFGYYKTHMDSLRGRLPQLGWNFGKSVFPCCAFNLSRVVWAFKHRDSANLPFGWCAITALAKKGFRPHLGGHLILWELGLVIEFPHASTVLIPSATITHSNVKPAPGDERMSFTQFAAGALFRYIDNRFCNDKQLFNRNRKEFRRLEVLKSTRWEMGLSLYSKLDDLVQQ